MSKLRADEDWPTAPAVLDGAADEPEAATPPAELGFVTLCAWEAAWAKAATVLPVDGLDAC